MTISRLRSTTRGLGVVPPVRGNKVSRPQKTSGASPLCQCHLFQLPKRHGWTSIRSLGRRQSGRGIENQTLSGLKSSPWSSFDTASICALTDGGLLSAAKYRVAARRTKQCIEVSEKISYLQHQLSNNRLMSLYGVLRSVPNAHRLRSLGFMLPGIPFDDFNVRSHKNIEQQRQYRVRLGDCPLGLCLNHGQNI